MPTFFWVLAGTIFASAVAVDVLTIVDVVKIHLRRRERPPSFAMRTCCGNREAMMCFARVLMSFTIMPVCCSALHGQESLEKVNSHFGAIASVPLHPMGTYTSVGWGLLGGIGYNFNGHHSAIGEFMWATHPATDAALLPLQQASGQRFSGHSNLYVLTGNYRFERRGAHFGAYVIAGGGLYYRTTNPSIRINSGSNNTCTQAWLWWGFKCSSGIVLPNQQLGSTGSNAFGGNVGIGFTARVAEEPYRVYVESRYHYAPTKNISTQLVTIGVGIRY